MDLGLQLMSNNLYRLTNANKEELAERILNEYAPKSLNSAEPIDVDQFMEEDLNLTIKSEHLSINNSVLGLIAFNDTYIECYNEIFKPKDLRLQMGDVVIEKCLTGFNDRKRLRFTKMHEAAHWILHRTFHSLSNQIFAFRKNNNYIACRSIENFDKTIQRTTEDWMEWQADALAAAILMPKKIFSEVTVNEIRRNGIKRDYLVKRDKIINDIITSLSEIFEVSKKATKIRLKQLGLVKAEFEY